MAADVPRIYSNSELGKDKKRYTEKFEFLLDKGLWDFMTPDEQRALRKVVVRHPLRGSGLLTMKSVVFKDTPVIDRAESLSLPLHKDV